MLYLVTALGAEARPLIEHFGLRRDKRARPFPIHRGDNMALVVSGVGKTLSAAATAYLWATGGEEEGAFLDLGIAGSRRAVGEAVLAHTVVDRGSGRRWYPSMVLAPPCPLGSVVTVDRVERDFDEPQGEDAESPLYEMEAAGFFATASRLATAELVHCLKIVSDGPGDEPEKTLDKHRIRELITARLDEISILAQSLSDLADEVAALEADPADFEACVERWHFTVSDRVQLERHLRRRQHLAPDTPLPLDNLPRHSRGRDVNRRLREWLDGLPVRFE